MDAAARVQPIAPATVLPAPPARRWLRTTVRLLAATLSAGVLAGLMSVYRFVLPVDGPAPVQPPHPLVALSNTRPVTITMTTPEWTKISAVVTFDRLHTDRRLWRRMHLGDWDAVDPAYRISGLRAMIRAYAPLFAGPAAWRTMTARDWDDVPQPVRSMAYLRMIWHWARVEGVGAEFGMRPEQAAQTIGAIVMAESWFEHRATNQNQWGNRDLGLAQCSDFCRTEIEAMVARCEILFRPSEQDYFNPWIATRVATIWFRRELRLADGDVELAARAYHRGIDNALDEKGDIYLAKVLRLRQRYILAQGSSETWHFLVREIGALGGRDRLRSGRDPVGAQHIAEAQHAEHALDVLAADDR